MGNLKVNETRGKSIVDPVNLGNYKGDVLVQTWIDSRLLATVSEWLDGNGLVTRHMSDIVKFVIEEVVSQLVREGEVEMIELCGDARDLLERKYRTNLNPGGRGKKNILHNLVLDDRKGGMRGRDSLLATDEFNVERVKKMYEEQMLAKNEEHIKEVGNMLDIVPGNVVSE